MLIKPCRLFPGGRAEKAKAMENGGCNSISSLEKLNKEKSSVPDAVCWNSAINTDDAKAH